MATYVFVHGGWDGGWAWRAVARRLQSAGHEVFTPSLTGSGERAHLATPEVDLNTHITDVVNVLQYEKLEAVILAANSYGGMVITGVAEQAPERIRELIYLDAFIPEDGESLADIAGPEIMGYMDQAAAAYGDGWKIPHDPPDADRRTPMLLNATRQPLSVKNDAARELKHTFVHFTGKPADDFSKPMMEMMAARAVEKGWNYFERPFVHWPILDRPDDVAALLLELASS